MKKLNGTPLEYHQDNMLLTAALTYGIYLQ